MFEFGAIHDGLDSLGQSVGLRLQGRSIQD
jgi:hypothetical protein